MAPNELSHGGHGPASCFYGMRGTLRRPGLVNSGRQSVLPKTRSEYKGGSLPMIQYPIVTAHTPITSP